MQSKNIQKAERKADYCPMNQNDSPDAEYWIVENPEDSDDTSIAIGVPAGTVRFPIGFRLTPDTGDTS